MIDIVRIDPVDVLYLRGNRLFAELGDADALMPPWPSLFAGALRSRMLADLGAIERFRAGALDGEPGAVLGSRPSEPGSFRVAFACLHRDGVPLLPLPGDLVVVGEQDRREVHRLVPVALDELGVQSSSPLPCVPVLRAATREKPRGGFFLTAEGVRTWQAGGVPDPTTLVASSELWAADPRLGIALSAETGTAKEGALYTTRTVALRENVGFLVGVTGAGSLLPRDGLLRLGGDGRGASVRAARVQGAAPWDHAPSTDDFTMMLVTPGMFERGWLPTGAVHEAGRIVWRHGELCVEIVAAVVPRAGVVSGWDLARGEPKTARRVVQPGAVYWMKRLEGGSEALTSVREDGLRASACRDPRRAEGFDNVWFGDWAQPAPAMEG